MDKDFLKTLRERGKKSKVYRSYQLTGLEIAEILDDQKHKALYIKLAKENRSEYLIALAKDIKERSDIRNRGAYFMKLITEKNKNVARPNLNK